MRLPNKILSLRAGAVQIFLSSFCVPEYSHVLTKVTVQICMDS